MTAVVGILNKQAVAVAADSAVTINSSNGHRIFNQANKVFTLSKRKPIGVMIYSSASFMGTPWETIIKVYRQQLYDKCFSTVNEYQRDFIRFLQSKDYYTTPNMQLAFLELFALDVINSVINDILRENIAVFENASPEKREQFLKAFEEKIYGLIRIWSKKKEFCPEFIDYNFTTFETYSNKVFEDINERRFKQNGLIIPDGLSLKLKRFVYTILRTKEDISGYTGLIFTGFGENEIYPQLIPVNISMVVDNRLRYYVNEQKSASISNNNIGAICPFAQTDVIDTILTGVDPQLEDIYLRNFVEIFKKYNQAIIDNIGGSSPLLSKQIRDLKPDSIVAEINKMNGQIKREKYINPLMNAVSNLAKEDLAEMAESLIYLTYLKRRITFAEESVGGPIDVAIISKGDGFVWIKRKHYFKPELNQHFFDNYFKR